MTMLSRPSKLQRVLTVSGLVVVLWLAAVAPLRADGTVRGFYFYSPDCVHCQAVARDVLPRIQEKFGNQVELRMFDVRAPQNYQLQVNLEEQYGVKTGGLPEAFIGKDVVIDEAGMRNELDAVIARNLAAGGTQFPTQDMPADVPTPAPVPTVNTAVAINMAYFFKAGCAECERTEYDLQLLQTKYPNLKVTRFDIADNGPLAEALGERAGVPEDKRMVTPAVFVGNEALVDTDVSLSRLQALIERYKDVGAPAVWQGLQTGAATDTIVARFRSFGVLTILGAGLIDGLNPCAFATIIFFISYLAFLGRTKREIVLVGSAFTLGVFLTYLLVGFGVLKFVQVFAGLETVGRVIYGLMGLACLIFAVVSAYDAWQARRGKVEEMKMRLPRFLQQRVHKVIRENSAGSAFAVLALVTGFVVSLIELACTGQVYLPTIIFVMRVPELRSHAVTYLVLYNLAFVLPLVGIFVLAVFGTSSARLGSFMQKHTATIKVLTAVVFVLLGIWLLSSLL